MKIIREVVLAALIAGVVLPSAAWAKADIQIAIKAEKEVTVTEKGEKVKRMVEAKDVVPGEIITYNLAYSNNGDEAATDIAITDPIPSGMTFIPGSATETGEITFSIDNGKSFKKPSLLTYEVNTNNGTVEKFVATPELYTHIRWTLANIPPQSKGVVSFNVQVK